MDMTQSKNMARQAINALEDKKAEDIRVIDISEVSVVADYFNNVQDVLGRSGYMMKQVEGYNTANWILMDFGDVIVHIFDKENRLFYNLERIWRDGKVIDQTEL